MGDGGGGDGDDDGVGDDDGDDVGAGADEFLLVGGTREANYAPVRHLTLLLPTKILVSAISLRIIIMVMMVIVIITYHCRKQKVGGRVNYF